MNGAGYPFVPKSSAHLQSGQFWGVQLDDGRYACGRVLRVASELEYGVRTTFVAGLMDWLGTSPPTSESIAGARILEVGYVHVRTIRDEGGEILGLRPLEPDGITVPPQVRMWWGTVKGRAAHLLLEGDLPPRWEIREIRSPLTDDMLRPFTARRGVVQFQIVPSDDELRRLAGWLRDYPQLELRAYGGGIVDLEFLRFFPFAKRFTVNFAYQSLQSLDGLKYLPADLTGLMIGWTKRRLDLGILRRFTSLTDLYLEGQTKGIGVLSDLTTLEDLTLRSITLPDLSLLLPLKNLQALDIKLGGIKELSLLPEIGRLRYLELWMIKGLTDVSALGNLRHLRYLFLQALRRVEVLPDLKDAVELRRVHLETMKGIRDLRPLRSAPALEELLLVDMPQLQPDDLRPLIGMPTLKAVTPGLGSLKKNAAARALLGLPETRSLKRGWRDV